jgi:hypothetical protein
MVFLVGVFTDVLVASYLQNRLDLCDGDNRCHTGKDEVANKEQTYSTGEDGDFYPGWTVVTPG